MNDDPDAEPNGRIRYTGRLAEIGERLARVETKLDGALQMRPELVALAARVGALEIAQASSRSAMKSWQTILNMIWGLMLALIAAGVWFK